MVVGSAKDGMKSNNYIELHAHSNHSLLDGVASPEELVTRAAAYEMPALALTDHDGLYGAVRFIRSAETAGIKPILGAEMTLTDGAHLTLLAETAEGYANLSQLITLAHQDQPKGTARLDPQHLIEYHTGLIALSGCTHGPVGRALRAGHAGDALAAAQWARAIFGRAHFFIELQRHYHPGEARLTRDLCALAQVLELDVVATGNVHYLESDQREIHDLLTCTRLHTTLDQAGDLLRPNADYHFHTPQEMTGRFADHPQAIANTARIAERCASATTFLREGHQILPAFETPDGSTPSIYLRRLCEQALRERYPTRPPRALMEKELGIIQQLELANYFLIVADIVHFARTQRVRCQGRGSAANSLVAYLLNISPIDPVAIDLVFERFLSTERPRPPDIDIDFAADRREEVIQYVYERYGRDHAAMACTLVTFRAKSAVRDTARALGFPPALIERLSEVLDTRDDQAPAASLAHPPSEARVREAQEMASKFGADLSAAPFRHLLRLAPQLEGIPRHLGIHNGGMILSGPPLATLIPLEPATMPERTVVQWDKDTLEDAGIIKIDILGLRMLSAIEDAVTIAEKLTGTRPDLDALTPDDPEVYAMLCRGETVGVFQVESRAQASLIPNFKPTSFADLTIQIALIRPGPLQGHMVRPYLRRRQGLEPVRYLHPLLKPALEETLGVIVFQEQVLKVARDLAGFTPGEGDQLRRALSNKRSEEAILAFKDRFIQGARRRISAHQSANEHSGSPVNRQSSDCCIKAFSQLQAFGGYSFPKSHAAAFAVLTYQSAWLRRYYPAAFFAALLRHQPMGFYPAHVIVSEARRHGVEIRGVDLHASGIGATVETEKISRSANLKQAERTGAIRLGLEMVRGLGAEVSTAIVQERERHPFSSLEDLCHRARLGRRALEALIMAGALDGWQRTRRQLLWELQGALQAAKAPPALGLQPRQEPVFTALPRHEHLRLEQIYTGATSDAHLTALVARQLREMGTTPTDQLVEWPDGTRIRIGGIVVARQQPPTANGIAFLAVEDKSGIVNVVLYPEVLQTYRRAIMSRFLIVEGEIRRDGAAMAVLGNRVLPLAL
jgi:error-prone DNA polymerase